MVTEWSGCVHPRAAGNGALLVKVQTFSYKIDSRDLMDSVKNIINNAVFYTYKLVRESAINIFITKEEMIIM